MKEVVAFLLARSGGNVRPTKEDIFNILDSVGITADDAKMDALFTDLERMFVSVDEAIAYGKSKLAVVGFPSERFSGDMHMPIKPPPRLELLTVGVIRKWEMTHKIPDDVIRIVIGYNDPDIAEEQESDCEVPFFCGCYGRCTCHLRSSSDESSS